MSPTRESSGGHPHEQPMTVAHAVTAAATEVMRLQAALNERNQQLADLSGQLVRPLTPPTPHTPRPALGRFVHVALMVRASFALQAAQKRSLEASTAQSLEASLRADRAANEAHGHSSMSFARLVQ